MSEDDIPESFYCPITCEVMEDPVIDPEGNSFERSAIVEWLRNKSESPITRTPLRISQLKPNRALRDSIAQLRGMLEKKKQGDRMKMKKKAIPKKATKLAVLKEEDMKLSVEINESDGFAHVSVKPPKPVSRTPLDICCVVDISGSMSTEATMKNDSGGVEKFGLSLLDVVKHAVKTIIEVLEEHDRMALVVFSTQARVVFELKNLTKAWKKQAILRMNLLKPEGSTNLWDGLQKGMEILRKGEKSKNEKCIMLLTDGCPNIVPPRGHVPMLKKYKRKFPEMSRCTICTFGFGYSLDSQLLEELSVEGRGAYSYIPDSSFVGTAFVNMLSNLQTISSNEVIVKLKALSGVEMLEIEDEDGNDIPAIPGCLKLTEDDDENTEVHLSSCHYGQTRDFIVKLKGVEAGKSYIQAAVQYRHRCSEQIRTEFVVGEANGRSKKVHVHRLRLAAVDAIRKAMELMREGEEKMAIGCIKNVVAEIRKSRVKKDKLMVALLKDLTGQVSEALSKTEWFDKWGKHYLLSLTRAHQLQQCNNFKDPGVQLYGGKLFEEMRDKGDDIFVSLPPPKPSVKAKSPRVTPTVNARSSRVSPPRRTAPVSMSRFHDRYAPCFDGDCLVEMSDGSSKAVKDLKRGDSLRNNSSIVCVVRTECANNKQLLCELGSGLLITPWHPVRVAGKWEFPINLSSNSQVRKCEAVYSFLLDSKHTMFINGVECCTWAHGFRDNSVIQHPFFGTPRIVKNLKGLKGWEMGLVELESGCVVRDATTGLVCGLVQK